MINPDIKQRLRDFADNLRRTNMPLADLIPLLQQAADEIEKLEKLATVGNDVVGVTTSVQQENEWPAIPPLWMDCMEERNALRETLDFILLQNATREAVEKHQQPIAYAIYGINSSRKGFFIHDVKAMNEHTIMDDGGLGEFWAGNELLYTRNLK